MSRLAVSYFIAAVLVAYNRVPEQQAAEKAVHASLNVAAAGRVQVNGQLAAAAV